jgi:hypothetical protein
MKIPDARSQAAAEEALDEWEIRNPDRLSLERDDGQFFGFSNVARGYLEDVTRPRSIVCEARSQEVLTGFDLQIVICVVDRYAA